jgi:hypothetical protein
MTINVNAALFNRNETPLQTSLTINKPADTRSIEQRRDTDRENLERADERRLQENRAANEVRPQLAKEGHVIGTTINTTA